jgi:hypothetical protein
VIVTIVVVAIFLSFWHVTKRGPGSPKRLAKKRPEPGFRWAMVPGLHWKDMQEVDPRGGEHKPQSVLNQEIGVGRPGFEPGTFAV